MERLLSIFLIALTLCGTAPQLAIGNSAETCSLHSPAKPAPQERASCCAMACCQNHAQATVTASSCCHRGNSHSDSVPQDKSSTSGDGCPCCPGACCVIAVSVPFWTVPNAIGLRNDLINTLTLQDELVVTRNDQPALPPPKVMLVG
ncbi:hypothetical protein SH661x_000850 [Planctomicrobium sp. SH661]|uniref:hypothetical protein n=1 Tax=Planctomicrobium sp. SH661 TaxID=3448124 RepID=UPI003F5B786E